MLLVNDSFNFCLKLIPYFLLQLTAGGIRHELPFWYTDFETFLRCQRQPFPHECLFRCVFGKCHTLFSSFLHTFFHSGRCAIPTAALPAGFFPAMESSSWKAAFTEILFNVPFRDVSGQNGHPAVQQSAYLLRLLTYPAVKFLYIHRLLNQYRHHREIHLSRKTLPSPLLPHTHWQCTDACR